MASFAGRITEENNSVGTGKFVFLTGKGREACYSIFFSFNKFVLLICFAVLPRKRNRKGRFSRRHHLCTISLVRRGESVLFGLIPGRAKALLGHFRTGFSYCPAEGEGHVVSVVFFLNTLLGRSIRRMASLYSGQHRFLFSYFVNHPGDSAGGECERGGTDGPQAGATSSLPYNINISFSRLSKIAKRYTPLLLFFPLSKSTSRRKRKTHTKGDEREWALQMSTLARRAGGFRFMS